MNNEQKPRTYYNRAGLTGSQAGHKGQYPVLELRFSVWNKEEKAQQNKFHMLFLTEENNQKNRETLQLLGVDNVPEVVNVDAVKELRGLGFRTVDLVEETNDAGYANIKYINEPKYGQKVFDLEQK